MRSYRHRKEQVNKQEGRIKLASAELIHMMKNKEVGNSVIITHRSKQPTLINKQGTGNNCQVIEMHLNKRQGKVISKQVVNIRSTGIKTGKLTGSAAQLNKDLNI